MEDCKTWLDTDLPDGTTVMFMKDGTMIPYDESRLFECSFIGVVVEGSIIISGAVDL